MRCTIGKGWQFDTNYALSNAPQPQALHGVHPSVAATLAWQTHQLLAALPNRGQR